MRKLKKALPIIIILLVVVLGVGAWWFLGRGKGGASVTLPGGIKKEAGETGEGFTGKLKEAVDRGVPLKCTSSYGGYSSTSYIKGKKVFGEISHEGKEGYMLMIDKCMWSWNKDESQGVKVCFEEDVWDVEEAGADVPAEAEYQCSPALFSESKFDLPSDVTFMDMEQLMQGMGQ